ncbi:MAG: sulfite exporter TauE/SafE family protein [Bacteroidia bacterium]|nr:sulfite exporter TauE/SafE family protein [Bacteroidia bacterium]
MNEILILLAIGLVAGYMSGLVGIGGGLVIVPVLVYVLDYTQHKAQGTTLFMFLFPIGILGVMQYYKAGNVDWKAAAFISATFIIGNLLGSKTALSMDQATIKKVFGAIIILLGIKMIFWK